MNRRPNQNETVPMDGGAERDGFTLIETLAATVLAACLMIGVLGVIGSFARADAALERHKTHPEEQSALMKLLRWDLSNAQSWRQQDGRIVLQGWGSLDPTSRAATHRPATVIYRTIQIGTRQWLVRRQLLEGTAGVESVWQDLLCPDVADIQLLTDKDSGINDAIPRSVRVELRWTDAGRPPIEREIALR